VVWGFRRANAGRDAFPLAFRTGRLELGSLRENLPQLKERLDFLGLDYFAREDSSSASKKEESKKRRAPDQAAAEGGSEREHAASDPPACVKPSSGARSLTCRCSSPLTAAMMHATISGGLTWRNTCMPVAHGEL
jgi:hypothetical protein